MAPLTRTQKALDPRLRRLTYHLDEGNRARLRTDVDRAFIASAEPLAAAALPAAEQLRKRVLVKLAGDRIPEAMAQLPWTKLVDEIYSVNVPVTLLRALAEAPGVVYVSAGHVVTSDLNTSLTETRATSVHHPPPGGVASTGAGVVVGIIDFGCDYTLEDFRQPSGGQSRLAFLWDQSLTPTGSEQSPAGFGHGVEYAGADIDAVLSPPPGGPPRPVRHVFGLSNHGTHVMGIAAGNGRSGDAQFPSGRYVGTAPEATIIFVQPAANDQQTTFTDSVHVAEAVAYIFQKAQELGRSCVINMSLGQNGGSHDGESVVERAIDRLLEEPGRAFVVAAGNEHVWRGHASGTLAAGGSRSLHWRVGGPSPLGGPAGVDRTANEMEIWYSSRDRFSVRVTDPNGETTAIVLPGSGPVDHPYPTGNRAFIDSERFTVLNGDARIYIEISPGTMATVTSGVWVVEITAVESRDGGFDAWIERDLRDPANGFADQSFFEGPDSDPVKTLGTPATTRRVIAVANYRHALPQAISTSSGRGPTRDERPKPEVAAPGTGIFSSNSRGGKPATPPAVGMNPVRVSMSGTSMAAPHVAGIVALMLERNNRLTSAQIAGILVASTRSPSGALGSGFSAEFGFGLVDARAAVDLVG